MIETQRQVQIAQSLKLPGNRVFETLDLAVQGRIGNGVFGHGIKTKLQGGGVGWIGRIQQCFKLMVAPRAEI